MTEDLYPALVDAEARVLALQEAMSLIAEAMNYQTHNGSVMLRGSVETLANCARREQWDGSVEEFARLLDDLMEGSHTPRRYTNGPTIADIRRRAGEVGSDDDLERIS